MSAVFSCSTSCKFTRALPRGAERAAPVYSNTPALIHRRNGPPAGAHVSVGTAGFCKTDVRCFPKNRSCGGRL